MNLMGEVSMVRAAVLLMIAVGQWGNAHSGEVPVAVSDAIQTALGGGTPLRGFEEDKTFLGFDANDRLEDVVADEPDRIYTLDETLLALATETTPVSSLLTPTDGWFALLRVGGIVRCGIWVTYRDGVAYCGSVGTSRVAIQWGLTKKQWPADKGYTPLFVQVLPYRSGLVHVPQLSDHNLTPLGIGSISEGLSKPAAPYSLLRDAGSYIIEIKQYMSGN